MLTHIYVHVLSRLAAANAGTIRKKLNAFMVRAQLCFVLVFGGGNFSLKRHLLFLGATNFSTRRPLECTSCKSMIFLIAFASFFFSLLGKGRMKLGTWDSIRFEVRPYLYFTFCMQVTLRKSNKLAICRCATGEAGTSCCMPIWSDRFHRASAGLLRQSSLAKEKEIK